MNPTLKDIAWNSIRLKIPSSWEIARIGAQQLIFQDDKKPKLELKWNSIKGKFSHKAHLKRLSSRYKHKLIEPLEKWTLPATWQNALKGFVSSGFSWKADTHVGRGMSLFCPVCHRATLIQFFFDPSDEFNLMPPTILKTLKDHGDDGKTDWSVFDIRATLPEPFRLKQFQFHPGNFALEFSNKKQSIHLLRWAPASLMLGEKPLAWFGETLTHIPQSEFTDMLINGWRGIEWRASAAGSTRPWFRRLTAKPEFQLWRFWHLADKNRILGMKTSGDGDIDLPLINTICGSYETR